MNIRGRAHPDGALTRAAHRALLAARSRGLGADADPHAAAIARAMRTTATGRFSAGERAWVERIEARRRAIPASDPADELRGACPHWSIPRIWGRFLMRLVGEIEPRTCVEMGIGFGMSGAYQAAALEIAGAGRLSCLDQEESLAAIARDSWSELGLSQRIDLRMGPIGETLAPIAESLAPIDYAYIDAEHTEAATVANFEAILPHTAPGAVVVVDDILIDDGMRSAWQRIAANPRTAMSVNLRRVGIVTLG